MVPLLALALAVGQLPADRAAKWEKEVAGIEKRLAADPPTPGGVVFVGSSSIRLWDLETSFPGAGYVNVGFGGSEVRDCTHFAGRLVTKHKPRAVVFYAGDNDLNSGRSPTQVRDDFRAFVKAVPDARIIFIAVKPSPKRWALYATQAEANRLVKAVCESDPRLKYLDVVSPMLGGDGRPRPELFVKDELHLSPAGYAVWVPLVNAALRDTP
jgi:lysophospholipase L1-like esterase